MARTNKVTVTKATETVPDTQTTAPTVQKKRPGRPRKNPEPEAPAAPTRQTRTTKKNQQPPSPDDAAAQQNREKEREALARAEQFEQTRNDQHDKVLESVMMKERAVKRSLAKQAQETQLQLAAANDLNAEKESQLAAANARTEELEKQVAELKRQMQEKKRERDLKKQQERSPTARKGSSTTRKEALPPLDMSRMDPSVMDSDPDQPEEQREPDDADPETGSVYNSRTATFDRIVANKKQSELQRKVVHTEPVNPESWGQSQPQRSARVTPPPSYFSSQPIGGAAGPHALLRGLQARKSSRRQEPRQVPRTTPARQQPSPEPSQDQRQTQRQIPPAVQAASERLQRVQELPQPRPQEPTPSPTQRTHYKTPTPVPTSTPPAQTGKRATPVPATPTPSRPALRRSHNADLEDDFQESQVPIEGLATADYEEAAANMRYEEDVSDPDDIDYKDPEVPSEEELDVHTHKKSKSKSKSKKSKKSKSAEKKKSKSAEKKKSKSAKKKKSKSIEKKRSKSSEKKHGSRSSPMADRPQEDLVPNVGLINLVQPQEQEPKIRTIYKVSRRILEITLMETYKNKRYAGDPDAVEWTAGEKVEGSAYDDGDRDVTSKAKLTAGQKTMTQLNSVKKTVFVFSFCHAPYLSATEINFVFQDIWNYFRVKNQLLPTASYGTEVTYWIRRRQQSQRSTWLRSLKKRIKDIFKMRPDVKSSATKWLRDDRYLVDPALWNAPDPRACMFTNPYIGELLAQTLWIPKGPAKRYSDGDVNIFMADFITPPLVLFLYTMVHQALMKLKKNTTRDLYVEGRKLYLALEENWKVLEGMPTNRLFGGVTVSNVAEGILWTIRHQFREARAKALQKQQEEEADEKGTNSKRKLGSVAAVQKRRKIVHEAEPDPLSNVKFDIFGLEKALELQSRASAASTEEIAKQMRLRDAAELSYLKSSQPTEGDGMDDSDDSGEEFDNSDDEDDEQSQDGGRSDDDRSGSDSDNGSDDGSESGWDDE
ncbi:hypothetical protein BJ508DRAFT_344390 [Ascobolus immersus RN42]|uniref:Uncharacterized protein n=1 Tax=Ascobolus immersus RN42 TaxID=1160509 RepID=A0A3N4HAK0_ASCIM|nr:hypothetical protein BJ508DRAFT_344390 [Ascobolus immersus RN42]